MTYKPHLLVGQKDKMDKPVADGFRQVEWYQEHLTDIDPIGGGGIYPSVPPTPNTTCYYFDPVTGFYWASAGSSNSRWKLATNNVHTSIYVSTVPSLTVPTTETVFPWDSAVVDNMTLFDQVYAYTYIFPIPGYYLISWQIAVYLSPGNYVDSHMQTRTGTGTWSNIAFGNRIVNTGTSANTYYTGATFTYQPRWVPYPPNNTVYTVPAPYLQLRTTWIGSSASDTGVSVGAGTFWTIDLIGTYDSTL